MRTLSITMQINGKTIAVFPDPSIKEQGDLVAMARGIAQQTWYDVDLVACTQLSPDPLDVEWRICRYDREGNVKKLWMDDADTEVEG